MNNNIDVSCESCGEIRSIAIKQKAKQFKLNGHNKCRSCSNITELPCTINGTKVLKDLGNKLFNNYKKRIALFLCNFCGSEFEARVGDIKSGKQNGCLCRSGIKSNGKKDTPKLYMIWESIRSRCNCKTNKKYKDYGGRGISVCSEWSDFNIFKNWSFENGYIEGLDLSIDREENNDGYNPDNCRWVNKNIQAANKRYGRKTTRTNEIGVYPNGSKFYYEVVFNKIKYYEGNFATIQEAVKARKKLIIDKCLPNTKERTDDRPLMY